MYIYERLSQGANQISNPTANGFNRSVYTSNGYAVLTPDITYEINDPGMSAVWSVPARVEGRYRDRRCRSEEYTGENHGLRKPANQRDYTARMKAFFDHYLKGAPAPDWMLNGVPRLKMEEHLKERAKPKTPPKKITTSSSRGR